MLLSYTAAMQVPVPTECSAGPILIRRYTPADTAQLCAAAQESIDTVGRWLPWCHAGYSEHDAATWVAMTEAGWAREQHFAFGVFDSATHQLLGGVGINQIVREHLMCNLGYWTRASATGRGVATTAALLAARFAFSALELARIEIVVAIGNAASQRVAEKIGAHFEGVARQRLLLRVVSLDAWQYSLTRGDLSA